MDQTIRYIFLLSALLIVVAYFVGASTDTNSLASGMNKLILSLTGRNSSGAFAAYPTATNAGTVQGG
jgi:hypothetical protein